VIVDGFLHTPEWTAFLDALGFEKERELLRMYSGSNRSPGLPRRQWAASGPELG
jgi:hypothetical protein